MEVLIRTAKLSNQEDKPVNYTHLFIAHTNVYITNVFNLIYHCFRFINKKLKRGA